MTEFFSLCNLNGDRSSENPFSFKGSVIEKSKIIKQFGTSRYGMTVAVVPSILCVPVIFQGLADAAGHDDRPEMVPGTVRCMQTAVKSGERQKIMRSRRVGMTCCYYCGVCGACPIIGQKNTSGVEKSPTHKDRCCVWRQVLKEKKKDPKTLLASFPTRELEKV